MKTDYDFYLIGCREWGVKPISLWRFNAAYGKYRRGLSQDLGASFPDLAPERRQRIIGRWQHLQLLADLVSHGREVHERARRHGTDEDSPGAAGAGMREPRPPQVPVLTGCAARPLPNPEDPLKGQAWWRV